MALLRASLSALKRELAFDNVDLLRRMVDAMICKVALMLPERGSPKTLKKDGMKIVATLLEALRRS